MKKMKLRNRIIPFALGFLGALLVIAQSDHAAAAGVISSAEPTWPPTSNYLDMLNCSLQSYATTENCLSEFPSGVTSLMLDNALSQYLLQSAKKSLGAPLQTTVDDDYLLPVSSSLTPGNANTIESPCVFSPSFIVGADSASIQWIKTNFQALKDMNARGMATNVQTDTQLVQIRLAAGWSITSVKRVYDKDSQTWTTKITMDQGDGLDVTPVTNLHDFLKGGDKKLWKIKHYPVLLMQTDPDESGQGNIERCKALLGY
jgi:integrating conjugative element protein (TIGR03765 family)